MEKINSHSADTPSEEPTNNYSARKTDLADTVESLAIARELKYHLEQNNFVAAEQYLQQKAGDLLDEDSLRLALKNCINKNVATDPRVNNFLTRQLVAHCPAELILPKIEEIKNLFELDGYYRQSIKNIKDELLGFDRELVQTIIQNQLATIEANKKIYSRNSMAALNYLQNCLNADNKQAPETAARQRKPKKIKSEPTPEKQPQSSYLFNRMLKDSLTEGNIKHNQQLKKRR